MTDMEVERDPLEEGETIQTGGQGGEPAADDSIPPLQLSAKEREILDLYDRLEEIRLETSLLQAQGRVRDDPAENVSEKELQEASEKLLEAKARYTLRSTIIESVLIANPILKAIHAGPHATAIERDLQRLIEMRDQLSVSLTQTTARSLSATENLTKLEAEHIIVARRNAELATKVISLAEEVNSQKKVDMADPNMRAELDELEGSIKTSRQRWRMMKGTASGAVAGSGVDWARDPGLRELVLDTEGD